MKPFDLIPTADDFARALSDFEVALSVQPSNGREFNAYAALFRDAGQKAQECGDAGLTTANDVFNSICLTTLSPDSSQPLGKEVEEIGRNFHDGKESFDGLLRDGVSSPTLWYPFAQLRWAHYDALCDLYPTINDADLRARVADLLWLTRKDFVAANESVNAYLISSEARRSKGWVYTLVPLQRALRIEGILNPRGGPALQKAQAELQSYTTGDASYHSAFLMQTMLDIRRGDPIACGALAEVAAGAAENQDDPDYSRAENYWILAAKWRSVAKDQTGKVAANWSLARCYEKHAEFLLNRADQIMPHSHAAHWIEKAVVTLRNIGSQNAKAEVEKLYIRLQKIQSRALGEMPVSYHQVNLSDGVAAIQQHVTGRPLVEALAALAYAHKPFSLRVICRESHAIALQTPLLSRTLHRQISPTGGTAATNTLTTSDEKLLKRERRRVRMVQYAHLNQGLCAQGSILPALQVINNEHRVSARAVLPVLQNCIFVLQGHELLFARGLVAGALGDWTLASHLLIPQIEMGLRGLLVWRGATIPDEVKRGKREWGMQEFLKDDECCARLGTIFSEALLYDARVLLVEKFGANLRPHFAHGLLPQGAFALPYASYMAYVWWLALRLCFDSLQFQASAPENTLNADTTP